MEERAPGRRAAENLPTFPASAAVVALTMAPATSRAPDLLTSPVPSVIVCKTSPPARAPSPASLCTTGPMATVTGTPPVSWTPGPAPKKEHLLIALGAAVLTLCVAAAIVIAVSGLGTAERPPKRTERRVEAMLSPPAPKEPLTKLSRRLAPASLRRSKAPSTAQPRASTPAPSVARRPATTSAGALRKPSARPVKPLQPARP